MLVTDGGAPAHTMRAFADLLADLARPDALSDRLPPGAAIEVRQTHGSAVILAGDRAYKLKKPRDFGFFDFSTPALRRHFCEREVLLNRRLAPSVYFGVAPVLLRKSGRVYLGAVRQPGDVPDPGADTEGGHVVDFVVVMQRLPDTATLAAMVAAGTARPDLLEHVARRVAAFHASSRTDAEVARFGGLEVIAGNWDENLAQMRPYIGRLLDRARFEQIETYVRGFLAAHAPLFATRVQEGNVRDCHGDLRLEHVYAVGADWGADAAIAIIDCIEFNDRFRYGDVASEVAFLMMELDGAGRPDLARVFADGYVRATGDEALRELVPFYTCYRACVRGKVAAFQMDEAEVPTAQRIAAQDQATALFALAAHYASGPQRPVLALVGGLMGAGKSTLAGALAAHLGWTVLSSDETRKRLAQVDPTIPHADAFGQGIYGPGWTARTYQALRSEARAVLESGRSVLLDATWGQRDDRLAAGQMAAEAGAACVYLECTCPRDVALARLAQRWAMHHMGSTDLARSAASDGRPELFDAQLAAREDFDPTEEPEIRRATVATDSPLAVSVERGLDALRIPHLECRL